MPRVLLLIAILVFIAFAVRSMLRAIADLRLDGLKRELGDDELAVPEDLPEENEAGFAWLHRRLVEAYAAESESWAIDQVRRVDARLQADVPETERMETVVLWIPEATAFTFPGRHVYLSRRLQERAPDETVAFIVAHEMAHHRLGHLDVSGALLEKLPAALQAVAVDLVSARKFAVSAEREAEADVHALNLCLAAGYDARRCLGAFDLLEQVALDWGDREGVFGPDSAIDSALAGDPEWVVRAKEWWWERRRGYPALRERKASLLALYETAETQAAAAEEPEAGDRHPGHHAAVPSSGA